MNIVERLITTLLFGTVLLAATACATVPPGEDSKGQELRAEGAKILDALIRFKSARGDYPSSLYELVPQYVPEIPFQPHIQFDRDNGTLLFIYERAWPRLGQIACAARPGDTQWRCVD